MALWLVSGMPPQAVPACAARPRAALGRRPGPATRARRRAELAAALAACRFRDAAWFPALAAALAGAYDPVGAAEAAAAAPAAADLPEPVR